MAIIKKDIDTTVVTQLQAKNLMNNLLEGKYSVMSDRIYKMLNADILLCPIEKNGTISYDQELSSGRSHYDDTWQTFSPKEINHYLNLFELTTHIHEESSILFQVFNNGDIKQDLINKNLKYLESVQSFQERKINGMAHAGYPEPPNHFTLQDFFKYAFKNDLTEDKKRFLPQLISEYFTLDEIVTHGDFKDKQSFKAYIDTDLLDSVVESPCFSELKKVKIVKAKIK